MKKKARNILLPTDNKASNILKNKIKTDKGYSYALTYVESPIVCDNDGLLSGNHHLYTVIDNPIDDPIKEGDHISFSDFIFNAHSVDDKVVGDNEGNTFMKNDCKKIIATTDPELHEVVAVDGIGNPVSSAPLTSIPKEFIELYCKEGGIDEVMVEYECHMIDTWIPKVTSNNCIIIHPIKDTWTRDEVEEMVRDLVEEIDDNYRQYTRQNIEGSKIINDWIKENL